MASTTGQLTFAIETFKRIHPVEFQRRFLSQQTRHDGRAFDEFRNTQVVKGTISTAHGSSTVRIGNTTMVCGIKAEVSEPDVSRPNEGFLTTNIDLSPMCSASYRPGAPSEEAQVCSEHLFRLFSGCVDLAALCIEKGQAVWALAADVVCLKSDGNIMDAAIIALLAALEDVQLPQASLDSVTGVVSADKTMAKRLQLQRRLFPASFSLVDDAYLVADADDAEERLATGSLLVVLDGNGKLANVWKRGSFIGRDAIARCVEEAQARRNAVAKALK
ncbi:hypothetical protein IWW36_000278 [Coemansia brasiliensis]|uniref:Ribosomal RNA-processing protein 43 n=1 Tax=Coemansia brasiliensis TaxID=2650707 RepID=A0A9W8IDT9_9FUNG|nr:hypothetical protein IWW36_000278 [Coemansia brasiliensis]